MKTVLRKAALGALAAAAVHVCLSAQVPYARILRADAEPQHWLTYSGGYRSHRHSALPTTPKGMGFACRLPFAWTRGRG